MASDKPWYWAVRYEEIAKRPYYDILLAMRSAGATNYWSGYAGRGKDYYDLHPHDESERQLFFFFWANQNPHMRSSYWDFEILGISRNSYVTEEKIKQEFGRERAYPRSA